MLTALRSRRHIAPFTAHRPATIAEALALKAAPGAAAYLAGGIDLIDWMKQGHALDRVIRLDGIAGLSDITFDTHGLHIGAMATHAVIGSSAVMREAIPDLVALWPGIANPRVRYAGTIGGNVMAENADYDGQPALLALGAMADLATLDGPVRVALNQIDGLVTGFMIPDPACRLYADRSLRPALTVWLGLTLHGGRVRTLRLAVGMAHPKAVCVSLPLDLPMTALGHQAADIAADLAARVPEPMTDGRASAVYRRRMVGVLARRLLVRAGGQA